MRLLMITGAGPGIGKTTLATSLAAEIPRADFINENGQREHVVFERPEFADVGPLFRRRVHPSAAMLEEVWARLVSTIDAAGSCGLMDWSFADLAEDLDWAMRSVADLHEHSRRVRAITRGLAPRVLYLDGDIGEGIRRREADRGREWFERRPDNRPELSWTERVAAMETDFRRRRDRVLGTFEAADWPVTIVNADDTPAGVLAAAREALF